MKPNGIRLLIVAHAFDTGGGHFGFWKNRNDRLSAVDDQYLLEILFTDFAYRRMASYQAS
jgi:hypothetical protein